MKIFFPLFQVSQTSTILMKPKNGRLYVFFSTTRQIIIGRFEHGRESEYRDFLFEQRDRDALYKHEEHNGTARFSLRTRFGWVRLRCAHVDKLR